MNTLLNFVIVLVFVPCVSIANNIAVSTVVRLDAPSRDMVTFVLSWENSWYVTGTPANHDAAWVFIKYRECGATGEWAHALLSQTHTDHTLDGNLAFADTISNLDRLGNTGDFNSGAMIRRAAIGTGHIVNLACSLKVTGGAGALVFDASIEYDIRVIAIEMVCIPEASFAIGDNSATNYNFRVSSSDALPVLVLSEGALSVWESACGGANKVIPADYPKGFGQFYCMKYEISMGQYADFLNTIPGALATQRYPSMTTYRHSLYASGGEFVSDTKDRACNWLSYNDVLSYLDWAALRPMSELEYEKVCKGTGAMNGLAYAWGSTTIIPVYYLSGTEDGSEYVLTPNANAHIYHTLDFRDGILPGNSATIANNNIACCNGGWNNTGIVPTDPMPWKNTTTGWWTDRVIMPVMVNGITNSQGYGPLGCGIFARDTTLSRETTGATYYGVMEMSGNMGEVVVTYYGAAGCGDPSIYTGIWGDGMLSATGLFNTTNWPASSATNTRSNGWKGGSWNHTAAYARVSDRYYTYNGGATDARQSWLGGRGVR